MPPQHRLIRVIEFDRYPVGGAEGRNNSPVDLDSTKTRKAPTKNGARERACVVEGTHTTRVFETMGV
jgi:hypothetical protein